MKLVNKIDGKILFLIFAFPGIILSLIQARLEIISFQNYCSSIEVYQTDNNRIINPHWAISSIYQLWIGNNLHNNYSIVLFYVLPFEVSLFCLSFCKLKRMDLRIYNNETKKSKVLLPIFLLSGSIASVPLLLNYMTLLLFVPVIRPDSVYNIYYSFFSKEFLSHIFYTSPLIYIIIYLLLNLIYFGLVGSISVLIYQRVKKWKILSFLPEAVMIFIELLKNKLCGAYFEFEVSPLSIVFPAKSHYTNWSIIVIEIFMLCLIIMLLSKVGLRDEKKHR